MCNHLLSTFMNMCILSMEIQRFPNIKNCLDQFCAINYFLFVWAWASWECKFKVFQVEKIVWCNNHKPSWSRKYIIDTKCPLTLFVILGWAKTIRYIKQGSCILQFALHWNNRNVCFNHHMLVVTARKTSQQLQQAQYKNNG